MDLHTERLHSRRPPGPIPESATSPRPTRDQWEDQYNERIKKQIIGYGGDPFKVPPGSSEESRKTFSRHQAIWGVGNNEESKRLCDLLFSYMWPWKKPIDHDSDYVQKSMQARPRRNDPEPMPRYTHKWNDPDWPTKPVDNGTGKEAVDVETAPNSTESRLIKSITVLYCILHYLYSMDLHAHM